MKKLRFRAAKDERKVRSKKNLEFEKRRWEKGWEWKRKLWLVLIESFNLSVFIFYISLYGGERERWSQEREEDEPFEEWGWCVTQIF